MQSIKAEAIIMVETSNNVAAYYSHKNYCYHQSVFKIDDLSISNLENPVYSKTTREK